MKKREVLGFFSVCMVVLNIVHSLVVLGKIDWRSLRD